VIRDESLGARIRLLCAAWLVWQCVAHERNFSATVLETLGIAERLGDAEEPLALSLSAGVATLLKRRGDAKAAATRRERARERFRALSSWSLYRLLDVNR